MWTAAAVSWQRRESRRQVVWRTWAPNTQTDGAVSAWAVSPEWRDNYNRETHFTHLRPNLSINMLNDTLEDQLLYFIRTQIWFWQRINILRLLFHCSVKICFCQSDKSKWFQLYLKKKYPSVHPSIRLTVCLPVWKSIRLSVHSICLKKSDCPCENGICLKKYVCLMVWKHLSDRLTVSRNASWGWLESLEQLWLVDLSTGLWVIFFSDKW